MNEFEDRLNSLLSDPSQMEKIANIAKSIMGGEAPPAPEQDTGFDPAMLAKIGSIMSRGSGKSSKDKRLLEAMRPYLSEKRRSKMDKALKIAELAGIAEIAMSEFGGGGEDV